MVEKCLLDEIHRQYVYGLEYRKSTKRMDKISSVTLHKKGSPPDCKNYRTRALMSHLGKVLMLILTEILKSHMEEYLADEQAGFRKDRSTVQQMLALQFMAEKT